MECTRAELVQHMLDLGELFSTIPDAAKVYRGKMIVDSLVDRGIARSLEEGYILLMEAYNHAQVTRVIREYNKVFDALTPEREEV